MIPGNDGVFGFLFECFIFVSIYHISLVCHCHQESGDTEDRLDLFSRMYGNEIFVCLNLRIYTLMLTETPMDLH